MRSKQERNQIITSEEKGRLRNHCVRAPRRAMFPHIAQQPQRSQQSLSLRALRRGGAPLALFEPRHRVPQHRSPQLVAGVVAQLRTVRENRVISRRQSQSKL